MVLTTLYPSVLHSTPTFAASAWCRDISCSLKNFVDAYPHENKAPSWELALGYVETILLRFYFLIHKYFLEKKIIC